MQVRSMAWNEVMQLRQLSRSPSQNRQHAIWTPTLSEKENGEGREKGEKKVLKEYKEKSEWK